MSNIWCIIETKKLTLSNSPRGMPFKSSLVELAAGVIAVTGVCWVEAAATFSRAIFTCKKRKVHQFKNIFYPVPLEIDSQNKFHHKG